MGYSLLRDGQVRCGVQGFMRDWAFVQSQRGEPHLRREPSAVDWQRVFTSRRLASVYFRPRYSRSLFITANSLVGL